MAPYSAGIAWYLKIKISKNQLGLVPSWFFNLNEI
jgi:hypothetical protein